MMRLYRRSKYRNVRTKCLSGHNHASKLEAEHCNRLLASKKAKLICHYDTQKRYPLTCNGLKVCDYVADFYVIYFDGREQVHETKGVWTDVAKLKRKWFEACYPGLQFRVIKKGDV